MARDTTPAAVPDSEVMASVDDDDGRERLIIADVSRDGAWISAPTETAIAVSEWR